jgi:hypothetical protein
MKQIAHLSLVYITHESLVNLLYEHLDAIVALFLASDEASYVNGTIVPMDGSVAHLRRSRLRGMGPGSGREVASADGEVRCGILAFRLLRNEKELAAIICTYLDRAPGEGAR